MPCDPTTSWGTQGTPASGFSGACATPPASSSFTRVVAPLDAGWSDGCVDVTPAPTLTSLNPATTTQGINVNVILVGTNFTAASVVAVSGSGVTVQNVVFVSDVGLTADFIVALSATVSTRNVTVTTENGISNAVNFVVAAFAVTPVASLQLWLEADYGIAVADGQQLPQWSDRSLYGRHATAISGIALPTYLATGFGAGLPTVHFAGSHGLGTVVDTALATFTVFIVARRTVGDVAGLYYVHSDFATFTGQLFADRSFCIYADRGLHSAREKNFPVSSWIPTAVRKLFRHEMPVGLNADHQLYMNSVNQGLVNSQIAGYSQDPGAGATALGGFHIGCLDLANPVFNLTGDISALLVYSPALSAVDTAIVETYLAKWSLQ